MKDFWRSTFYISLMFAVTSLGVLFLEASAVIHQLPFELEETRSAITSRLDMALAIADGLPQRILPPVLQEVDHEARRVTDTADQRLGRIQQDFRDVSFLAVRSVNDHLEQANAQLGIGVATIQGLRNDLHPTVEHLGTFTGQLADAAPLFLDCDHNPDCVFNRWVGMSKGIERSALNFGAMTTEARQALPHLLRTFDGMTADSAAVAQNLNRLTKPRWYDRVLGYGFAGLTMWRDLNPASSVVSGFTNSVITKRLPVSIARQQQQ